MRKAILAIVLSVAGTNSDREHVMNYQSFESWGASLTGRKRRAALLSGLALVASVVCSHASAAQGDMGTGTPSGFNMYETPGALMTMVWSLASPTIQFPSGCSNVILSQATMGLDGYKQAVAVLLTAKVANLQVRFYATQPRDGGCGVDMVQINP